MADLYQKALESERKSLWAFCRLRGLAKDTPERLRIAQIDAALKEHAAKKGPAKVVDKAPVKKAPKVAGNPKVAAKAPLKKAKAVKTEAP